VLRIDVEGVGVEVVFLGVSRRIFEF
jgi:hypothetical protein